MFKLPNMCDSVCKNSNSKEIIDLGARLQPPECSRPLVPGLEKVYEKFITKLHLGCILKCCHFYLLCLSKGCTFFVSVLNKRNMGTYEILF